MKSFMMPRRLHDVSNSWLGGSRKKSSRPSSLRKARIGIEHLENRLALSSFTVTNLNSSGGGSLALAVSEADLDRSGTGVVIRFDPSLTRGSITPSSPLVLNNTGFGEAIEIDAPSGGLTVSGGNRILPFVVDRNTTVTLNGLSITQGHGQIGGGIVNSGNLLVENCVIYSNVATDSGGGIMNWDGGNLTVYQSYLLGNSATNYGGGIHNIGSLRFANSSATGNSANWGGGIYTASNGNSAVSLSTFLNNTAQTYGGGLANSGGLEIDRDSFNNNHANKDSGGGVYNSSSMSVVNSTFTGNSARDGGALASMGAGHSTSISGSTLSFNVATYSGGGIFNSGGGVLTVQSSTLWSNSAQQGGAILNLMTGTANLSSCYLAYNRATGVLGVTPVWGFGTIADVGGVGGAIDNCGTLVVATSTLTRNSANTWGGAIQNWATLNVTGSSLNSNSAFDGGGIHNGGYLAYQRSFLGITWDNYTYYYGSLTVQNNTVLSNNQASDSGGGIYNNYGSSVTIVASMLSNNSAFSAYGGGIFNYGSLWCYTSTITNNFANTGGGVQNFTQNTFFSNDSIIGNHAKSGSPDVNGAPITIVNQR